MTINNYSILIADDEPIECIALEMLLKNNFPGLRILPSVSNGIDLAASVGRDPPDIAIVDINMPGLNGLDALDMVRSRNPDMKIIIHSAYSEFDYAKRAFALGASDYMVKPIQKPVFLDTMKKILESLGAERQKKSSQETIHRLTGEVHRLAKHDIMSSILLGEVDDQTAKIFLDSLNQEYEGGFLVTARHPDNTEPQGNPDGHLFPNLDSRTLYSTNTCAPWNAKAAQEILTPLNQVCLCLGRAHYQDLLLYLIPGPGVGRSNYRQWAGHLLESLHRPLLFGVSSWKFTLDELPAAWKESSSVLIGRQDFGVFFFEHTPGSQAQNVFLHQEEPLARLLASGQTDQCLDAIDSLLQKAVLLEMPLDSVKTCSACFLLSLHRQMADRSSFPLQASGYIPGPWKGLWDCPSWQELKENLHQAVCQLGYLHSRPISKSWEYVTKAFLYIENRYSQDISLEDVAQLVGISPFYLSRLLKQELNETFVEILTKVRIGQALILLQDPQKTIRQIGEEVGYGNTTYFYKVFKKQTGMTVGEVRRML